MKICLVTEHYPPHIGGVEIVFQEYAKRLAERGHQVRVITSNSGGIFGKKNNAHGTELHYLKCKSFFGHPLFSKKKLARHIKWADIVHTTTFTVALPTVSLSKKYDTPCVIMVHEVLAKKWFSVEKNPFLALGFLLFEWFVITKKYSLWHTISKSTEKDLLSYNIPHEKIKTIYHGIDYSIWKDDISPCALHKLFDVSPSRKIFLYNGRPGQTKGLFILLEAIKKIKKALPQEFVFGFIISKEPKAERFKFINLIKKYSLNDIIKISDPLPYAKLPCYRKSAFAFIVPSIAEGFGFTTAETAAINIPLIVSNAGSIPEVASGKVLMFENKNSDDLADKILLATKNKFANIPPKKFSWNKTIDKIETVYKELLETK
jgi:glycosyltransferase involved in cell wall biosynthesis